MFEKVLVLVVVLVLFAIVVSVVAPNAQAIIAEAMAPLNSVGQVIPAPVQ